MEKDIIERLDRIEKLSILAAKNVLNIDDVAILTGMSKGYVYQLTHDKKIPFYKPTGKQIYFKRSEVEEWMTRNRYNSVDEAQSKAVSYVVRKDGIIGNTEDTAECNGIEIAFLFNSLGRIRKKMNRSAKLYCDLLNKFLYDIRSIIPKEKIPSHVKCWLAKGDTEPLKRLIKERYEQKAKDIADGRERQRFLDGLFNDYEFIENSFNDMKSLIIGNNEFSIIWDVIGDSNFSKLGDFMAIHQRGFGFCGININGLIK
jgi:excisionase family DNA binding protein